MTEGAEQKAARGIDPSIDPDEVARFAALADEWWDADGKMAPLHHLNPVRLGFIRDRLSGHFGRDPLSPRPLRDLSIIDVGCGGGLLCEPLARLGAAVTGIDAAEENTLAAAAHAAEMGLNIDYRAMTAGELAAAGARYDAVVSMEVVEHVADVDAFIIDCCALVKPGGAMVLATLNRTSKAFLQAIVGAEHLMRWLPRGTHDWRKFVRPSELARALGPGGMRIDDITGVTYDLRDGEWKRSPDVAVNYMLFAVAA
ncbi:MAG: bifunctional 2-polyprenyl-6-hydroxyphenol methylase/3-demethylubiquinol 3-O-methyltransferase UbiG [Alphaproteobacteria bacterium]